MDQEPLSNSEKELEIFRETYRSSLPEFIENLSLLGDTPLPPNPSSLDIDDVRDWEDLAVNKQQVLREELMRELGVDTKNPEQFVRQYISQESSMPTVPGDILVRVFKTNREDIFLQQLLFKDEEIRFMVGPDMDV